MTAKKTKKVEAPEVVEETTEVKETTTVSENEIVEDAVVVSKEEKTKKTAYIYLGPNVKGGLLNTGSVFQEVPTHLDDIFEKAPSVKKMFVEVSDASKFKSDLSVRGTQAFMLRRKALEELTEV